MGHMIITKPILEVVVFCLVIPYLCTKFDSSSLSYCLDMDGGLY